MNAPTETAAADTPVDAYLDRFAGRCRRVTLIGPVLTRAPRAGKLREPIVWVDGGANHRAPIFRDRPGIAVGDGDSTKSRLDQYLPEIKDYSDLAFILRRIPAPYSEVVLLGFLGGRRDHELFNFGEAHHLLASRETPMRLRFDHSVRAFSKGEWQFHIHAPFSLAVLEPATVTLTGGCKFPIEPARKIAPLTSFGLSNRGQGEVTLRADGPVFIFDLEEENNARQYAAGAAANMAAENQGDGGRDAERRSPWRTGGGSYLRRHR